MGQERRRATRGMRLALFAEERQTRHMAIKSALSAGRSRVGAGKKRVGQVRRRAIRGMRLTLLAEERQTRRTATGFLPEERRLAVFGPCKGAD